MLFDLLYFPGAALSTGKIEFYSHIWRRKYYFEILIFFFLFKEHDVSSEEKLARTHSSLRESSTSVFDKYELKLKIQRLLATRVPTAKLHGNPNYSETQGPPGFSRFSFFHEKSIVPAF